MGRLVGYMANRADRLADVLTEEHTALLPTNGFQPDAWGIGFYQGGEVLHKKRPKLTEGPLDWNQVAGGVQSDCAILHFRQATVGDFRAENTHPFRMHHWLFAHNGTIEGYAAMRPRIVSELPDFLQRNIRGQTDSELLFHVLLSFLHDARRVDHPESEPALVVSAMRSTIALIDRHAEEIGAPQSTLNCVLTDGRNLYAQRRGEAMHYVVRSKLPSDTTGNSNFRYILVGSHGENSPTDYSTLPDASVLIVDRNLNARVETL